MFPYYKVLSPPLPFKAKDPGFQSENLTTIRVEMLKSMMELFGLMRHVADQLYKPFGPVECRLLSEDEYHRNVNVTANQN